MVLTPAPPTAAAPPAAAPPAAAGPASVVLSGVATKKAGSAKAASAQVGQAVTLQVSKLAKKKTYVTKIRFGTTWVTFGKVKSTKAGRATLDPFMVTQPGTYLIKLDPAKGRNYYAKVQIS